MKTGQMKVNTKTPITTFGKRLKIIKHELKLTDKQIAERLNFGRASVSQWFTTTIIPNGTTLIALSDEFDVSVDWLLGLSNERKVNGKSQSNKQ